MTPVVLASLAVEFVALLVFFTAYLLLGATYPGFVVAWFAGVIGGGALAVILTEVAYHLSRSS